MADEPLNCPLCGHPVSRHAPFGCNVDTSQYTVCGCRAVDTPVPPTGIGSCPTCGGTGEVEVSQTRSAKCIRCDGRGIIEQLAPSASGAKDEPLPCPFCGRAPQATDRASDATSTGHVWFLVCMCGGYSARAHQMGETRAEAVALWNRRVQPAAPARPPALSEDRVELVRALIGEALDGGRLAPVEISRDVGYTLRALLADRARLSHQVDAASRKLEQIRAHILGHGTGHSDSCQDEENCSCGAALLRELLALATEETP